MVEAGVRRGPCGNKCSLPGCRASNAVLLLLCTGTLQTRRPSGRLWQPSVPSLSLSLCVRPSLPPSPLLPPPLPLSSPPAGAGANQGKKVRCADRRTEAQRGMLSNPPSPRRPVCLPHSASPQPLSASASSPVAGECSRRGIKGEQFPGADFSPLGSGDRSSAYPLFHVFPFL